MDNMNFGNFTKSIQDFGTLSLTFAKKTQRQIEERLGKVNDVVSGFDFHDYGTSLTYLESTSPRVS